ncbi:COMM domain-containing protein 3 isoform X2 [Penaeus vannamei]|uniref:COMM domain-containing protein 3 n=1 Tax=Penaeus vannamei TaxID=6689 RepID=A0A3R7MD48_PENVA|nr:COMM domain-containing protein 3-like isoform X2 [Penaeus vannamei]ROT73211.1 putative COMM domain-containing protein 3 [Penaeus vannamei]
MDLSLEISSALRLLGNSTNFGQAEFKKVLQKATDDLINSGKVPVTSTGSGACDGTIARSHAALATLFIEAVKSNQDGTIVTSTLEDFNWPAERISETVKELDSCRERIRSKLASVGTYPPHIVDVDWKLDYHVRSSAGEEGGGAFYLITLHTEESDGRRGKVTFSCSLAQLSHLVTQLRQASRCIQKYANNS